ncbi:PREDICTED: 2-hydroxyacylsphingosine 1-beta-galactosyltransferase-like [Priapulus caudatus]|uniref:UDP-glucuronosyltransferase n=1 Tax=Priapulus caudatus TaxID=37621 RepID=A0ABM1ECI8_PRICU|nr:PREDICTED: 2-hydroxyacylsphingosine 1-beta-galactosyltransferase-like [Priapulus caudatus]
MNIVAMATAACVLATLLAVLRTTDAGNILMVPVGAGRPSSHRFVMEKAATVLAENGHSITWLLGNEHPPVAFGASVTYASRPATHVDADALIAEGNVGVGYILNMLNQFVDACAMLLNDRRTFDELRRRKFDLMFLDAADLCGFAMADGIGVPYAAIVSTGTAGVLFSEAPAMLSFSPSLVLPYTNRMTFAQRFKNTLVHVFFKVVGHVTFVRRLEGVARRAGFLADSSIEAVARRTNMHFVVGDFSFDYPIPVMPNTKHIGVITAGKPLPLAAPLQEFVQRSAARGVVVISFGSAVNSAGGDVVRKIAAAIADLPYFFVWRLRAADAPPLGDNVKIVDWIPQNDLLGHAKVVLFVTHAGPNSVWESVYHGVPMLALPIVADEYGNAARVVHHGVGKQLDFYGFTADEFRSGVIELITNRTYAERAAFKSRQLRANTGASSEGFLWWTNHLLETKGATYLRPASVELNFFQFYLLDVFTFLAVIGAIFVLCVWKLGASLYRRRIENRNAKTKLQ